MMDALSQNYLTEEVCGMDLVDRGYSLCKWLRVRAVYRPTSTSSLRMT